MNVLPNLLSQLNNDNEKYFIIKGKELIKNEQDWYIFQNDDNSIKLKIIIPEILGGFKIDENFNYYIDFLDGKNKPGFIKLETEIISVTDEDGKNIENYEYDKVYNTLSIDNSAPEKIIDNRVLINNKIYYIQYNIEYLPNKNYSSKKQILNYEDSALISEDYPNGYSNQLYFKKFNNKISITKKTNINNNNDSISYLEIEWIIDKTISQFVGDVKFSIRIENDNDFIWQSSTNSFTVKSSLNDVYYLNKEIEENFIISNREIKSVGEFNPILMQGDNNCNTLFYKINRYYQGQDLLHEDEKVKKLYNNGYVINSHYANIIYNISEGYFVNSANEKDINKIRDNFIQIKDIIYELKLKKIFNQNEKDYENFLTIYNSTTRQIIQKDVKLNENYSGNIIIDDINYIIVINNPISIKYEESLNAIPSDSKLLPVYHSNIRFIFTSPNQDYGDWLEGQIEYVNNEYFIFSWTPNNRVTRAAGEIGYYIEFSIKDNYNKIYSFSTLPSSLTITSNEIGTGSTDFLPHWVSYIENDIADDVKTFMNINLQSQYNQFEDNLIKNIFQDYNKVPLTKINEYTYVFKYNNINYTIEIIKTEETYSFQLQKEEEPPQEIINNLIDGFYCGSFNIYDTTLEQYITLHFTYDSFFNNLILLKANLSKDKKDYRPLIPVFWSNLAKVQNVYNQAFQQLEIDFTQYKNTLQNNFGYTSTEKITTSLKDKITNDFSSLFAILNGLYNENKSTINGGYFNGEKLVVKDGFIELKYNNEVSRPFSLYSIDFNGEYAILINQEQIKDKTVKYQSSDEFFENTPEQIKYYKHLYYKNKEQYIEYNNGDTFKFINESLNVFHKEDENYILCKNLYIQRKNKVQIGFSDPEALDKSIKNKDVCIYLLSVKQDIENYKNALRTEWNNYRDNILPTTIENTIQQYISILDATNKDELAKNMQAINNMFNNLALTEMNAAIKTLNAKYEKYLNDINNSKQNITISVNNNNDAILHIDI